MAATRCILAILLTSLVAGAAYSQTGAPKPGQAAEEAYLRMRDAAIAKIKKRDAAGGEITDAQTKQDTRVLSELEGRLRKIVRPVALEGFSTQSKANLETLSRNDVGAGALDALVFSSRSGKMTAYVTTEGLFKDWLKTHETWFEQEPPLPQQPDAALRREDFYTQAISPDAAVSLYAALPVDKPANASVAIAQLDATSQDLPPALPDELTISVIAGGKAIILVAPLKTPFAPIPRCQKIADEYAKKIEKLTAEQNQKSAGSADDPMSGVERLEKESGTAGQQCFAQHAAEQPGFRAAREQAQSLIALVAKP